MTSDPTYLLVEEEDGWAFYWEEEVRDYYWSNHVQILYCRAPAEVEVIHLEHAPDSIR